MTAETPEVEVDEAETYGAEPEETDAAADEAAHEADDATDAAE